MQLIAVTMLNQDSIRTPHHLLDTKKEVLMFARNVTVHVKPNQQKEVNAKIDKEVLPLLRKANGFRDLITMSRDNNDTLGISLWNTKEQLDAYTKDTAPQVAKLLEPFITGVPEVLTYEVSSSTSHKYVAV